VVASEAFKINVRPSTNFQRMLISGAAGSLSSSADQLPQIAPHMMASGTAPPAPADALPPDQRSDAYGGASQPAGMSTVAYGGSCSIAPAVTGATAIGGGEGASPAVADVSPHSTPATTPNLDRRTAESFPGPTLHLFEWRGDVPSQASSPGHEALPVASLAHFQSAMLTTAVQQPLTAGTPGDNARGDAVNDSDTSRESQRKSYRASVSSILWPSKEARDRTHDHEDRESAGRPVRRSREFGN